jgi:hypothetical protein
MFTGRRGFEAMFAGKQRRVVRQMLSSNSLLDIEHFTFFFSGLLELMKAFNLLALTPSRREVIAD